MKRQAHQNIKPIAQYSKPSSHLEALESIRWVQVELDQSGPWPEHLTTWLQKSHTAALRAIQQTTKSINRACLNQDATGLDRAIAEYKRAWLNGLTLWRLRDAKT